MPRHKLCDKVFTWTNNDPGHWCIHKDHQVIVMKNIQFHQWQKGWHHENSQFPVKQLRPWEYNPLDPVFWTELNPGNCMASLLDFLDIKRICWQFLGSQGRGIGLSASMLQYIPLNIHTIWLSHEGLLDSRYMYFMYVYIYIYIYIFIRITSLALGRSYDRLSASKVTN